MLFNPDESTLHICHSALIPKSCTFVPRSCSTTHMSPTYILIDQGNSRLKIALATDEQLYPTRLYPEPPTSDQLLELMHSYQLPTQPLYAIYSSVGEREAPWLKSIQSVCQLFVTLDAKTPLPLAEVQYDRQCLGVDRVASVVGVAQLTTEPSLVIDIGTAITYDLLLPERRYMGGNISPGPELRLQALHDYTARLPRVPWSDIQSHADLWHQELGGQTDQAIWLGVARSIVHEIDAYIEGLRKRYPSLAIWITGGYAVDFVKWLKYPTFVETNLVERGLRDILQYQVAHSHDS